MAKRKAARGRKQTAAGRRAGGTRSAAGARKAGKKAAKPVARRAGIGSIKRAAAKPAARKATRKTVRKTAGKTAARKVTAKKAAPKKAAIRRRIAKPATRRRVAPARSAAPRPRARALAPKPIAKKAALKKAAPKKAVARSAPARDTKPALPKKVPALDRARRTVQDNDDIVQSPPSTLDLDRTASAARSGRKAMKQLLDEHNESSPALTAGDVDADWESAYSVGDEAPGGDNPTPDQDIVDDIGKALGVSYDDNEELKGEKKISDRDKKRWELDPASAEDYGDHEEDQ